MPRYRYQRHRAEDKKSLKGLVREIKGTDGKSFHEFVGNALVEFCGFEQEKNEAGDPIEWLLFYDFRLRMRSRVDDPGNIGENGFVQRRVNYWNSTLKARARVCTYYIGRMSFRNGRSLFGWVNLNHNYGTGGNILSVRDVLREIRESPEMTMGTIDQKFRHVGGVLEGVIRKTPIARGYQEELKEGQKIISFKSLYVSPRFIADLM